MKNDPAFTSEADLVRAFCAEIERQNSLTHVNLPKWAVYHETADWDVLLVGPGGTQVGIEAKLSLNAKVLEQALPGRFTQPCGPDYRAVLVPTVGLQHHLSNIALHLGISVITARSWAMYRSDQRKTFSFNPSPPDESSGYNTGDWHSWHPAKRCELPDYVPDVMGGKAAPVRLTDWKIKAIRLVILLDRVGVVTRKDMAAIGVHPSRWTAAGNGFLASGDGGYVRCGRTPDFRAQHPENYAQIEADFAKWAPRSLLSQASGEAA